MTYSPSRVVENDIMADEEVEEQPPSVSLTPERVPRMSLDVTPPQGSLGAGGSLGTGSSSTWNNGYSPRHLGNPASLGFEDDVATVGSSSTGVAPPAFADRGGTLACPTAVTNQHVGSPSAVTNQNAGSESVSRRQERLTRWRNWKEAVRREEGIEEAVHRDGQSFTYQQYLQLGRDAAVSHISGAERILEDVSCTGMLRKPEEQACLERVLLAYMGVGSGVIYSPSMTYIVAMLINVAGTNEEEEVFAVFKCLMEHYGLKEFSGEGHPMAISYANICERMVEKKLPRLYKHLGRLNEEMHWGEGKGHIYQHLCAKWFTTLFVHLFPPPVVERIWDIILSKPPSEHGGLLDALRIAYFVFELLEPTLLRIKDVRQMQGYFKAMRKTSADNLDSLNHCWLELTRQACIDVRIDEDLFSEVSTRAFPNTWQSYVAGTFIVACVPACIFMPMYGMPVLGSSASSTLVGSEAAVSFWPLAAPMFVDLTDMVRSASHRIAAPFQELAADAVETGSVILLALGLLHRPAVAEVAGRPCRRQAAITDAAGVELRRETSILMSWIS